MVNVEWTSLIVRVAILSSLMGAPNAAWSQTTPSQVQVSAVPVQQTETASDDHHSYLPPWMGSKTTDTTATVPVSVQTSSERSPKKVHRHRKREQRYADASGWGLFGD